MIYLDHAATTSPKPACVVEAVTDAMLHFGNSGRGVHEASLGASRAIYEARRRLAELFQAEGPEQVAFTPNATFSLNLAVQGLLRPGDHVITTEMDHNSVLRPLYRLEDQGVELTILKADRKGRICLADLAPSIRENTRAIFCTHASNVTGEVNDLAAISAICRPRGVLLAADVSQTAGILPVSMEQMGIDVLCFTGHKGLLGPQGTGGIAVGRGVRLSPLWVGGSGVHSYDREHPSAMPEALEAGTANSHGIAGLGAAAALLLDQREAFYKKEMELMWAFYDGVRKLPGVTVYGDFSDRNALRAPIVSLNLGEEDSAWAAGELAERWGIQVRAGAHCAPLMHRALGTVGQGAVRFSFSHSNTREDVEQAIRAVEILAEEVTA